MVRLTRFAILVVCLYAVGLPAGLPAFVGGALTTEARAQALELTGQPAEAAPSLVQILQSGPERLRPEQIDEILAILDDTQARQALRAALAQLSAEQEAPPPPPLLFRLRDRATEVAAVAGRVGEFSRAAIARDRAAGYASNPAVVALHVLLLLLVGFLVGSVARVALRRPERALDASGALAAGRFPAAGRGGIALAADLVGIAAVGLSLVLAYVALAPENPRAGRLFGDLLLLTSVALGLTALGRFLLAPRHPERRWTGLPDDLARQAAGALGLLLAVALVLSAPVIYVRFLDLPPAAHTLVRLVSSTGMTAAAVALAWANRRALAALVAGSARSRGFAILVAAAVTVYLLGVWLLWSLTQLVSDAHLTLPLLVSVGLVFAVPLLARAVLATLPSASRKGGLTLLAWSVSFGMGLWVLLSVWGVELVGAGAQASPTVQALFQAGKTLLIGLVGWLVVRSWLDRKIAEVAPDPALAAGEGGTVGGANRLATILPMLRVFALATIATLIILAVLSAIGVDIAPLLAGAGVVGLAIGFGAQSLVSDIVSGIFFLLDDAFRVGEYIEVGNTRGTVESISLRSLRLRHHMGAIHTLPFGQIQSLTNFSRDWVIMRLEFRLDPETDQTKLRKLVKKVGAELMEDEQVGGNFLEPLKSQGVRRVEEDAVIVGIKFKARPGTQFTIRKLAYQRLLTAFRENGINLVPKGVTVRVDASEGGGTPDLQAVGAAAGRALAEGQVAAPPPADDR